MSIQPILRKYHYSRLAGFLTLLAISLALQTGCSLNLPFDSEPSAASTVATAPEPAANSIPSSLIDEQTVLINLYRRVNPAVVNITAYGGQPGLPEAGPGQPPVPGGGPGSSQGSGFVYDQSGYIVTNAHVVNGAQQIEVTFNDGTVYEATLAGLDPHSDLAVLKVPQLPAGVQALPLANIDDLAVGQTVVAIGNPFGLEGTLTRGIISALGRTIPALTPFSIPHAIQTDAAINPGNSGGPLLDLQGRVIGVTAQGVTGNEGVNSGVSLAIPVDIVQRVIPALIETGRYEWAWLGVTAGGNVTPALARAMNLPVNSGAYLIQVTPGGPADRAGLHGEVPGADVHVQRSHGVRARVRPAAR